MTRKHSICCGALVLGIASVATLLFPTDQSSTGEIPEVPTIGVASVDRSSNDGLMGNPVPQTAGMRARAQGIQEILDADALAPVHRFGADPIDIGESLSVEVARIRIDYLPTVNTGPFLDVDDYRRRVGYDPKNVGLARSVAGKPVAGHGISHEVGVFIDADAGVEVR